MRRYAVIVAGGSGTRMGGGMPKQFRSLCGRPVLWWSMKAFHDDNPDTRIIVVLPDEFMTLWEDFFSTLPENERFEHITVRGGKTRTESVKNGLSKVDDEFSFVAVHDGARPLINKDLVAKGWEAVMVTGAAIPVIAVTDSLRKYIDGETSVSVDRADYLIVQTPQVFKTAILKESYQKGAGKSYTDDASVVEDAGYQIAHFPGNNDNIKITHSKDLAIAAVLMGKDA